MDVDAAKLDKRALAVLFNTGLEDVVYDIVSGYEMPETYDYCSGLLYLGSLDSSGIGFLLSLNFCCWSLSR